MTKFRETWWPEIHDTDTARRAARQAFWAAIVVVCITSTFAAVAAFGTAIAGITSSAFVDAALFGAIAIGIWRMSRVAAVAGLVVFGLEKVLMLNTLKPGNVLLAVAILFGFANGVRGTLAYHKLISIEPQPIAPSPTEPG